MVKRQHSRVSAGDGEQVNRKHHKLNNQQGPPVDTSSEEDERPPEPVGPVIEVDRNGKNRRRFYRSFRHAGRLYHLEDTVLVTPEESYQKPYVGILKDILEEEDGSMMVTGQWFYRPEEAQKQGGGTWQARDNREIFYSVHLDLVPAESVMHKCVVHFIPITKQLPLRTEHPGFIVQRVYDFVEKSLWELADKEHKNDKQSEIDVLVQKTIKRIGELPDIEPKNVSDRTDQIISKSSVSKTYMHPIVVPRTDDATTRSDRLMKAEIPANCTSDVPDYHLILSNFNALTGNSYRDRWLEKLLEGIQAACNSKQDASANDKKDELKVVWPDAAVLAITALEKAAHESLGSDFPRYNKKMRQLVFNLKNTVLLARRLLNKELDPAVIVNMTPNELKDGLTADENTTEEPEQSRRMQMTDARCIRCTEKKVGVADIIINASRGDRYQLECMACGNLWYAARDAILSLTIDSPSIVGNVGTAPLATAKFEDVERKKLASPQETEKPTVDILQKSTTVCMPVLETHKLVSRSKNKNPSASAASPKCGRYPPVVRTAVPVDGRFEHIVLSCNATSDHAIIWIEQEAQRAFDMMLEKEHIMEIPAKQRMEREKMLAREHSEEHKAALRRAVTLSVPYAYSPAAYGTFDENSSGVGEGSSRTRMSWDELIEGVFEKDEQGQMMLRRSTSFHGS